MKNKIYSKLIIILALVLCLVACDGAVHLPLANTITFELDADSLSVEGGQSKQLKAISSKKSTVIWSSSDSTVASVSEDGTVTANKYGTATITAKTTIDDVVYSDSCEITVPTMVSITFNSNYQSIPQITYTQKVGYNVTTALEAFSYDRIPKEDPNDVFDSWFTYIGSDIIYFNDRDVVTLKSDLELKVYWIEQV